MNHEFHNLQEHLKKVKPQSKEDANFEHVLRRSLLNSDYFSANVFVRIQKRMGLSFKTVIWPATSVTILAVGMLFLNTANKETAAELQPTFAESTDAIFASQNFSQNLEPREIFTNWLQNGRIQYKGQEADGARIYTLELDDGKMVELTDPNPVTITLTSAP